MTASQIDQAARQHADKHFIHDAEAFYSEPWDKAKQRYAKTLADFAKWCMSKQWISVNDRLPEDGIREILVHDGSKPYTIINPSGKGWKEEFEKRDDVARWMPIPKFNPEKEER